MPVTATAVFLQAGSHPADTVRRALASLVGQRGGVCGPTDLQVTERLAGPNMGIDVGVGGAWVPGTQSALQGFYYFENVTNPQYLALSAADATNPRFDLIVARVQDAAYSGATNAASVAVVTGTPGPSPAEPSVPANSLVLARVSVAAGATSITNANITDRRTTQAGQSRTAALGAPVPCTSTTRPTTGLYAGLLAWETDTKSLVAYSGSVWETIASANTAWTTPTLAGSWSNYGGAFSLPGYRRIGDVVYLRGLVARSGSPSANDVIFTLPAGFRPTGTVMFPAWAGVNTVSRVDINNAGQVTWQDGTAAQAATFLSLSGILFAVV